MINEIANVGPSEIDSDCHAGVGTDSIPKWDVHCVQELLLLRSQWSPVLSQAQKMDLMHVKLMIFLRTILDRPVFD